MGVTFSNNYERQFYGAGIWGRREAYHANVYRQQPVVVGCAHARFDLVLDVSKLLHLSAGVKTLRAFAPARRDQRVAILPGPEGRGGDFEHPRHGADRVDGLVLV